MNTLDVEFQKFDKKIWCTIGARFNAYRRLQRRQSASIFSISILSLYLMVEAFIPQEVVPTELEAWRKAFVVLSSVFILILSLLEARKSYELKAERLHNNAMALNRVYDSFRTSASEQEKMKKIDEYHQLILSCPENHEPCDDALFRASRAQDFGVGCCEAKGIKAAYFISTYWLYAALVLLPPLAVVGIWIF